MPQIRSVEAYRLVYGRSPTVAEFRAIMGHDRPMSHPAPEPRYCGYCYDPECTECNPE